MNELDDEISTSTTLLRRVAADPADAAAWDAFVVRYGRILYGWCRRWNLQDADAEDLTQGVLLQLARQMHGFRYDPHGRFRGWLRTVAYRAWVKFLESRKRPGAGTGDSGVWRLLESEPARDEFVRKIEEEADRELMERAASRVRARVMPHTWEAFRLTAEAKHRNQTTRCCHDFFVGTLLVLVSPAPVLEAPAPRLRLRGRLGRH